jgi:hypothetical protein
VITLATTGALAVHVIETDWLDRMRACRLYAYRLPTAAFRPHHVGGYWVADQPVGAVLAPSDQLNRRVQRFAATQHRAPPRPPGLAGKIK